MTDREQEFRDDLRALLAKHNAELEITDDGKPYGMATPIVRVSMESVYEGDKLVKDFCEFEL